MEQLSDGMPYEFVSERADVTVPVLKRHYDHRSMERKRIHRLEKVKEHRDGYEGNPASTQSPTNSEEWSKVGMPLLGLFFATSLVLTTTENRLKREFADATPGPETQICIEKEHVLNAVAMYPFL
ncbi:MAG: hypothetical protein ABEI86_01755 [Halobacteriaceae archaeon]